MWEKKVKRDGIKDATNPHDADNCYPWTGTCAVGGATCYFTGNCGPNGVNGPCNAGDCQATSPNGQTIAEWVRALNRAFFAGYDDWRMPNLRELETILDWDGSSPSVAAAFQGASCGAACTDITSAACSCTVKGNYWSSTTVPSDTTYAWTVTFSGDGTGVLSEVISASKTANSHVRAVRGGF